MQNVNISILRDRFEEENEASMALFLDCIACGEIGLAEKAAGIVIDVQDIGRMNDEIYERYYKIRNTLHECKKIILNSNDLPLR